MNNANKRHWLTAIDLFCGSGAVSAALKRKHFRVMAAVDNDPVACATYRLNHPRTRMIENDIRNVDPQEIRKLDLQNKDVDLMIVCAPCQPFSQQNRKKEYDFRSNLILESIRFALALKPRLIFFENVPGLASTRHSHILNELAGSLGPEFSLTKPLRIDAADYGVPQRRLRCIIMASRGISTPKLPDPITPKGKRVTVLQAIGSLSRLSSGQSDPVDKLHAARNHQTIALERLSAVPKDGGSRTAFPDSLALKCHKRSGNQKFSDVYGRMKWDDVAPTLTTGCTDITRGRFAHPEDDRAITLREASLLQTFPLHYKFAGNTSEIQSQIGNAVPVRLIEIFASTFRSALQGSGS